MSWALRTAAEAWVAILEQLQVVVVGEGLHVADAVRHDQGPQDVRPVTEQVGATQSRRGASCDGSACAPSRSRSGGCPKSTYSCPARRAFMPDGVTGLAIPRGHDQRGGGPRPREDEGRVLGVEEFADGVEQPLRRPIGDRGVRVGSG